MFTCDHRDLECRDEPIKDRVIEKFNKQTACEVTIVYMPFCVCAEWL